MFSPALAVTYISAKGKRIQSDYSYVKELSELFSNHGRGYSSEILGEVIIIAPDQRSATVEHRKKEIWRLDAPYDDISFLSLQRMEWRMQKGIPQIIRMSKEILERTILVDKGSGQRVVWPEVAYSKNI